MYKEQIVGLAARLFAIFLVIYTIRHVATILPYLNQPQTYPLSFTFVLVAALFPLMAAILLWLFPITIATKLIPKTSSKKSDTPFSLFDVEIIAFPIIGIWIVATVIPDVFYWGTLIYMFKNTSIGKPELSSENIAGIIATGVELSMGIWLLLGSKGIVSFIRKVRYG